MKRVLNMIFQSIGATLSGKADFAVVRNSKLEKKSFLGRKTRLYAGEIGSYSYTGGDCYFYRTRIGRFTSIADRCTCGLPEHPISYVSSSPVFHKGKNRMKTNFALFDHPQYKKTVIGSDVWIGSGVSIKAGVTIGDGAVIGMGSIVTKDIPPYAVAVGVPAKVIRYRFDEKTIEGLLKLRWWDWDPEKIRRYAYAFSDPAQLLKETEQEER